MLLFRLTYFLFVLHNIYKIIEIKPSKSHSIFACLFRLLGTKLDVFGRCLIIEFPPTAWAQYPSVLFYNFVLYFLASTLFQKISQYFTLVFPLRLTLFFTILGLLLPLC